jgi:rhamnose utilization protein RhaD (predicted bifunctional aldolase and dehydrogenase)
MNAKNRLKQLVSISHHVGNDVALIQGGGGNTSVKVDQNVMLIKASGTTLSALTEETGYAAVDYQRIVMKIHDDCDNDGFVELCNKALVEGYHSGAVRPSIETGFHALLGTFVIHSHSVYANILTCSKEGKVICSELFPDSLWIGFDKPGLELTRMIERSCNKQQHKVIFLENHGLVVHGESCEEVCALHDAVNARIQNYFDIEPMLSTADSVLPTVEYMQSHVLFPDQIVFLSGSRELQQSQAAIETISAYRYIYNTINSLGLSPVFIGNDKADQISNMSSENYRRGITK